jgi:hypothetical protein
MAKTRRKKINGKAPLTRNSKLVLVAQGDFVIKGRDVRGQPRGKPITGRVYTGEPVSKPYPYGSSRQGYGARPWASVPKTAVSVPAGGDALHGAG